MSSSEFLARPELPDLASADPSPAPATFEEVQEFERVERATGREASPEEAYRAGLAEGEARGREAAVNEFSPVLDELRAFARSLALVREERLAELESELVDIATTIAQHVVRAELSQSSETVLQTVRACLAEARDQGDLVLRAHPEDIALVRAHVHELELDLSDGSIRVEADPSVPRGGSVLETPTRCIDARPERVIEAARNALARGETP